MTLAEDLKAARDVAIDCLRSAHDAQFAASAHWYNTGWGPDDGRLDDIAEEYRTMSLTLGRLYDEAHGTLTAEVREALLLGKPHEVRVGGILYVHHHAAAVGVIYQLTAIPALAAERRGFPACTDTAGLLPERMPESLADGLAEWLEAAKAWPSDIKRGYLSEIRDQVCNIATLEVKEGQVRIEQEYAAAAADAPRAPAAPAERSLAEPAAPAMVRFTKSEAAKYVGVDPKTIDRWMKSHKISWTDVGDMQIEFNLAELDAHQAVKDG